MLILARPRVLAAAILAVCAAFIAVAQAQIPGGGVQAKLPITPGNCAQWFNSFTIEDAGKTCGGAAPAQNPLPLGIP